MKSIITILIIIVFILIFWFGSFSFGEIIPFLIAGIVGVALFGLIKGLTD